MSSFKQNISFLLLLIAWAFSLPACKTEEKMVDPIDYSYLKMDSGTVFIYRFDSIAFDDNKQTIDTFNYFLKEVYSGSLFNANGEKIQVIERYVGKNDTLVWEPRESAFAQLKNKTYERIDQNQRRLKLVFPIKSNAIWNGNVYNDLGKTNYLLTGPFDKKSYLDMEFLNVIEVQEANQVNFIETFKERSAYSKNTGLVYYESTKLSTQANKTGGYSIKQRLIDSY